MTRPRSDEPRWRAEGGAVTGGSLLQMVLILSVVGVLIFEVVSVVVSNATLDQVGRELARTAGAEYGVTRSIDATTEALRPLAADHDARVDRIEVDADELLLELRRDPPTLVTHRISPLEDLVTPTSSTRITWTS